MSDDRAKRVVRRAALGAVAIIFASTAAKAAVVTATLGAALTGSGVTITLGGGVATFTFTAASTGYGPGAAVSTGGNGQVATYLGSVADFGDGSPIDQRGELYTFAAYPATSPGVIAFSAADDFIGLAYTQAGAVHYGYAEVNGPQLVSYGYETAANTTILTRLAPLVPVSVPEPASMALMVIGCLGLAATRRHRRG